MRKITSVLLALAMALSFATTALADGTTLTISAPDTLPAKGETFTVTVDISDNPGLCAAQYTLAFDKSVVQCTGVTLGRVLSGTLSATNENATDGAIVACASAGEKTGDGVLSTYTFKVLKSGDADFSLTDGVFTDAAGREVATNVEKPTQPTTPKTPTTPVTPTAPTTPTAPQQGATQTTTTPTQQEATTAELFGTGSFTDVPADFWGYAEIEKAAALGLVTGNPDGTFAPEKNMTRAEFVTMLRRLSGDTAAALDQGFTDVKAGDWFCDAVNWAAEKGYATGDGVKFNPNGNITRQEVVTILYRFNGGTGGMETMLGAFGVDNLAKFADRGEIASWATDALHWAIYKGLVNGTTDTTVSPTGTANRAQVAAIFVRYAEK